MFTLDDLRERGGDARELLRALALHRDGALTVETRLDDGWAATCTGREGTYSVSLKPNFDAWCDCVAFARSKKRCFCKHVGALAMAWLEAGGIAVSVVDLDGELAAAIDRLTIEEARAIIAAAAGESHAVRAMVLGR